MSIESGYPTQTKKEAKISNLRNINKYNRKFDASPSFNFANASLATTAYEVFDIHSREPKTKKYGTFTDLTISNNSAENIWFFPNDKRANGIFIPAGTTWSFDRNALGGGYTSFSIQNASATTASANEIRITCFKTGTDTNAIISSAMKLFVKTLGIGMNTGAR